jgi:autotransporter family porin
MFLRHEQQAVEFPSALDTTSFGVRTDTGYRFGSFRHGLFIEPLATIGVVWANLEDFKVAPNHVDFDSDPNVRGRLGLRLSTTLSAWTGTTMEPSSAACGHFVGTANGHTHLQPGHFQLRGQSDDVSDDLSAGVNFFNQSANTSVFAKFDATLGNNLEGYGGKAGIRASC